jgi:hypothetical protein
MDLLCTIKPGERACQSRRPTERPLGSIRRRRQSMAGRLRSEGPELLRGAARRALWRPARRLEGEFVVTTTVRWRQGDGMATREEGGEFSTTRRRGTFTRDHPLHEPAEIFTIKLEKLPVRCYGFSFHFTRMPPTFSSLRHRSCSYTPCRQRCALPFHEFPSTVSCSKIWEPTPRAA